MKPNIQPELHEVLVHCACGVTWNTRSTRKELRIEKVVPGGKTLKIRVRALKPGAYPFIGEYHEATAKGRIVAE
jgi:ribosomal protein L31